ncbi:unnamed protein product [Brassica rapa]|uniref:Uncharacterized protein n=1 Tax=Brassica campestris TaxID=3711 RepID=A0A8D9FZL7_BRACM|nr:unnamed protein product [Brassica rapa]
MDRLVPHSPPPGPSLNPQSIPFLLKTHRLHYLSMDRLVPHSLHHDISSYRNHHKRIWLHRR